MFDSLEYITRKPEGISVKEIEQNKIPRKMRKFMNVDKGFVAVFESWWLDSMS